MSALRYWTERAEQGDPAVSDDGKCYGCGRDSWKVADGAADGCPVCRAFLDWCGPEEDEDDD